jgi:hypothetical protein
MGGRDQSYQWCHQYHQWFWSSKGKTRIADLIAPTHGWNFSVASGFWYPDAQPCGI